MNVFPKHLTKAVLDRWNHMVAGDYETPPCPPQNLLQQLLELVYLVTQIPDEGRFPQFNVMVLPAENADRWSGSLQVWPFKRVRDLTLNELRRLAHAVDQKKSAIAVRWTSRDLCITGLVDLGTSWHRARSGLSYQYVHPQCLLIQADGPGSVAVYQGQFRVASLANGRLNDRRSSIFNIFLHDPANAGLAAMGDSLVRPKDEPVREFAEFEFIALWNTYAGIVNSINAERHGGTLVIVPSNQTHPFPGLSIKFEQESKILKSAFIKFMNTRHEFADFGYPEIPLDEWPREQLRTELLLRDSHEQLIEATRFVARLALCDGAIVIASDLTVLGFSAEITATFRDGCAVHEFDGLKMKKGHPLDINQFGMRHRSAIKLSSSNPLYRAVVVSQDGAISGVWSEASDVLVQRDVTLVNANLPWS